MTITAAKISDFKLPELQNIRQGNIINLGDELVPLPRDPAKAKKPTLGSDIFDMGKMPQFRDSGASKPAGSMNAPPSFGGSHKIEKKSAPTPKQPSTPDSKYYDGPRRS